MIKDTHINTGLITDIVKDKDGKIISFTMIHSSSGKGPNEQKVTIGEGKLGEGVNGYYKWDSKPDAKSSSSSSSAPAETKKRITDPVWLMKIANDLEAKGLKNAAKLYRDDALKYMQNKQQ